MLFTRTHISFFRKFKVKLIMKTSMFNPVKPVLCEQLGLGWGGGGGSVTTAKNPEKKEMDHYTPRFMENQPLNPPDYKAIAFSSANVIQSQQEEIARLRRELAAAKA